ncbi:MAG TPA: MGMT family protein [Anaerolineae bacterium]|nr:MGMT family protein [Anaerolineae bacterium]
MEKTNPFQERVLEIVRAIPRGKILTYGQVALLAGAPRGARQVGRILYARGRTVPWQRVINRYGGLSTYKIGSGHEQRALLEEEGVTFTKDGNVDLRKHQWRPGAHTVEKLELPEDVVFEINRKMPFSR